MGATGIASAAQIIAITGPITYNTTPGGNDVVGDNRVDASGGWLSIGGDGSGVFLSGYSGSYAVQWLDVGSESAYTNTFLTGGFSAAENDALSYQDISALPGSTFPSAVVVYAGTDLQPVPFTFSGPEGSRSNGDAANDGVHPPVDHVTVLFSYASVQTDPSGNVTGISVSLLPTNNFLAWFDDGGAGPDDNHDDYVVLGRVSAIPLPATLPLFGTALAAGLLGWRRRKAASGC